MYKRKRNQRHVIIKWKARLVARGYAMLFGVDYLHSSSPVACLTAFRILLVIAMIEDMDISSGDIDGAFLNGDLAEDIDEPLYMRPPAGFEDPTGQGRVFRLKKSIYGLKNASYCWHKMLASVMKEMGYRAVDASECFWMYEDGKAKALFVVHVDDYVHAFNDASLDTRLVNKFKELWGVSGVGPLKFFLGMEIDFVKGSSVFISQKAYFEKVLKRFSYEKMKPITTPMETTVKISTTDDGQLLGDDDKRRYMEIVGSLIYGAITTRPDIANAVSQLGRVMNKPTANHLNAAKRVLRYIVGSLDRGLRFENKPWTPPGFTHPVPASRVVIYTDADWGGEVDTKKSMDGYGTAMAGGLISFRCALQKSHALSSAESEYVGISNGARDAVYVWNVLKEIGLAQQDGPIPLFTDSSAAMGMIDNKGVTHRTKHIALRYHFSRSVVDDKIITINKIGTASNPADILTKATDATTFARHADFCAPRKGSN
jgi:hypothetical protein